MPDTPFGHRARGRTGVPLVTSVTGPQTQTFNQYSPTPQLFAKSWLPGMGTDTLFMVPLQVGVPVRADVWALGMLSKDITLNFSKTKPWKKQNKTMLFNN